MEHWSRDDSEPLQATLRNQMVPVPWPNSAFVEALIAPKYPSCLHTTWVHAQKSMHMSCTVSLNQSYAVLPLYSTFILIHCFSFFWLLPHLSFPPIITFTCTLTLPFLPSSLPPSLPYIGIIDVPGVIPDCTPLSIVLHFHTTTARGGASHQT